MTLPIEDVQRLRLNPGDALVLKAEHSLSPEAHEQMLEVMQQAFPGHRVMVLAQGFDLQVVEPQQHVEATQ